MNPVRLVTLAPGHFHAALVQKEALRGVDPHTHIYAPLDADLVAHLDRIARFNDRPARPTNWTTDVHAGPDWFNHFLAERPGNTVVIAGRNRPKIDLILAAITAGYCVLADKPWIIEAADFPKLERVFAEAERNNVFAWDIMTERFEVTTQVQRELMGLPEVFGTPIPGTVEQPGLELESVHYLSKHVAGVPLRRPAWWFDPAVAGEAMADVGTHLADLALWLLFPNETIAIHDVKVLHARRWPTAVDGESFRQITGMSTIPAELAYLWDGDHLTYRGNGSTTVRVRDQFVRLTTRWGVRAEGPEGDTHRSVARGSRSTVTVRHDPSLGNGPQVFVAPTRGESAAVRNACRAWCDQRPGFAASDCRDQVLVTVPAVERVGHEAHFAKVLGEFVGYFRDRASILTCERQNLLAKYHITTRAVEKARENEASGAP